MPDYTKKTKKNKIAPKNGAPPLAVVEFSLSKDVHSSLRKALKPYVEGKEADEAKLGNIIHNHFPPQILEELSGIGYHDSESPNVYVIRNLPEIPAAKIPAELRDPARIVDTQPWMESKTYAYYIGKGFSQALGFKNAGNWPLVRYSSDRRFSGDDLHKHDADGAGLQGIISDNAPTRFTDVQTLLEEVQTNTELSALKLDHNAMLKHMDNDALPSEISLGEFNDKYPQWKEAGSMHLRLIHDHSMESYRNKAQFNQLVKRHSQEVVIGSGDMVLWSNHGRVFHQALQGDVHRGDEKLVRAVLVLNFDREHAQKGRK